MEAALRMQEPVDNCNHHGSANEEAHAEASFADVGAMDVHELEEGGDLAPEFGVLLLVDWAVLIAQQLLLPLQLFVRELILCRNMVPLSTSVLVLNDAKVVTDLRDCALDWLGGWLEVRLFLYQHHRQSRHAVCHINAIHDGSDANYCGEDEAQRRLLLLQIVHELMLPGVEFLVLHGAVDGVGALFALLEEVGGVESFKFIFWHAK